MFEEPTAELLGALEKEYEAKNAELQRVRADVAALETGAAASMASFCLLTVFASEARQLGSALTDAQIDARLLELDGLVCLFPLRCVFGAQAIVHEACLHG